VTFCLIDLDHSGLIVEISGAGPGSTPNFLRAGHHHHFDRLENKRAPE